MKSDKKYPQYGYKIIDAYYKTLAEMLKYAKEARLSEKYGEKFAVLDKILAKLPPPERASVFLMFISDPQGTVDKLKKLWEPIEKKILEKEKLRQQYQQRQQQKEKPPDETSKPTDTTSALPPPTEAETE